MLETNISMTSCISESQHLQCRSTSRQAAFRSFQRTQYQESKGSTNFARTIFASLRFGIAQSTFTHFYRRFIQTQCAGRATITGCPCQQKAATRWRGRKRTLTMSTFSMPDKLSRGRRKRLLFSIRHFLLLSFSAGESSLSQ